MIIRFLFWTAATFAFFAQSVLAAGELDPGFGKGGKVLTNLRPYLDSITEIEIDSNGNIVAVGRSRPKGDAGGADDYADWALAKYDPHGKLDPSFGKGGIVITAFAQQQGRLSDVVLQSDGKILVSGWNRGSLRGANIGLGRYLADGKLDPSFGTGGLALFSLGVQHSYTRKILPLENGSFLVLGHTRNNGDGTTRKWFNPLLMRFDPFGRLDVQYGQKGVLIMPLKDTEEIRIFAAAEDGKERILATGHHNLGLVKSVMVARLHYSGVLDSTLQQPNSPMPGVLKYELNRGQDDAWAITPMPDGGILVGGQTFTGTDYDFLLMKLDKNGAPDPNFGKNGIVTTPIGYGDDGIRALGLQKDGKIVAGGTCVDPMGPGSNNTDFCVARYHSNGKLDETFGTFERFPGTSVIDFGKPGDAAFAMKIQSDGKILIAGESIGGDGEFALARLLP